MQMSKSNGLMPMMMEMLQGGMPIQIPDLDFKADPFSKAFHNLSLRQLAKTEALKAEISGSRNIQAQNYFETMKRVILFGDTINEERQKMLDEQEKRAAENRILTAQGSQAYFEAKISEMDYEIRRMKFDEMKGGK